MLDNLSSDSSVTMVNITYETDDPKSLHIEIKLIFWEFLCFDKRTLFVSLLVE